MNYLRLLRLQILRTFSNLRKGKFKSIFRYFLDSKYRKDVNKTAYLVLKAGDVLALHGKIELEVLHFSHEINYPEWVDTLTKRLSSGVSLEPLKVMFDGDKYVVIDGNHRLKAYQNFYRGKDVEVDCVLLHPRKNLLKGETSGR